MTTAQPRRATAQSVLSLAVFMGITAVAPVIGGLATARSVNSPWFADLAKPSWNPPDWVFGPVWTVLYALMAVAAWLVWRRPRTVAATDRRIARRQTLLPMTLYAVQLVLNVLWSVLFFGMRQVGWAFAEIVVLWVFILATTVSFGRVSRVAAGLMTPYAAWVTFAAVLNFAIWRLNAAP